MRTKKMHIKQNHLCLIFSILLLSFIMMFPYNVSAAEADSIADAYSTADSIAEADSTADDAQSSVASSVGAEKKDNDSSGQATTYMPSASKYFQSFLKRNEILLILLAGCIAYLGIHKLYVRKKKEHLDTTGSADKPDVIDTDEDNDVEEAQNTSGDDDSDLHGFG